MKGFGKMWIAALKYNKLQQIEKKYFVTPESALDADSDFFAVAANSYVNAENIRMLTTDTGVTGTVEAIGSTKLISTPQPSISFVYNGGVEDTPNNRFLFFLADIHSNKHKIMACYADGTIYTVLLATQVTGGLNLSKDNFIDAARVVDGLLYWTDNLNEPRRLNIDAGIKLNQPSFVTNFAPYTVPLTPEVITIIRRPPNYPLSFVKKNAADVGLTLHNNQIKNNSFRFTYSFTFRDNEQSTLTIHSLLAPYNYRSETFDVIQLTVSLTQLIDQDVQKVTISAIYTDGEQAFDIKVWDKANPTDLAEINAHNAGTTPLTYNFTNNDVGNAVDQARLYKPFDSVGLLAKTLEDAQNRLHLGNNLVGYNSPLQTSLVASVLQQTIGSGGSTITVNGTLANVTYLAYQTRDLIDPESINVWFVYFPTAIDAAHPAGFYDLVAHPLGISRVVPVPPNPLNMADFVYVGADVTVDVMQYIPNYDYLFLGYIPFSRVYQSMYTEGLVTTQTTSSSFDTTNRTILKTGSSRKIAIVFYDKYMRQCGVVISATGLITIPNRGYALSTTYSYAIQWALSNASALTEIPDWAYYYSIVSTKDLTRIFFVQALYGNVAYATKDANGNYLFNTFSYSGTVSGIAVQVNILFGQGMGYQFQPGDIIDLHDSLGLNVTLSIIDQFADYVICESKDIGALSGATGIFEIYTPRPRAASEFYFEQGSMYNIVNPTTTLRQYGTILGSIPGDVFLLNPNPAYGSTYITENMSPNPVFWKNWFTNAGRLQLIDTIGQQRLKTSDKWSNTIIEGTRTNGLSSFDALDQKLLPFEGGELNKLQRTSKVNNELGIVMLGICEKETASMYLGEVQLYGSNTESTLSQAPQVIGTINILKGSRGTINPESVTEFRGNVRWYDAFNGAWVQYSDNGLFDISNFKMRRFWKLWSDQYLSMTRAQIEALGSRPYVFSGVDPHHYEVLISIPKLSDTPPKGYLLDYDTITANKTAIDIRQAFSDNETPLPAIINYYGLYYYITETNIKPGYYAIVYSEKYAGDPPPQIPVPASITFDELIFRGTTFQDVLNFVKNGGTTLSSSQTSRTTSSVSGIRVYTQYPFDILDFQAKTLVYKLDLGLGERPHWQSAYSFCSDGFISLLNNLYSSKFGQIWLHNQTQLGYNNFYGVQGKSRIMFAANSLPNKIKVFNSISIEGNVAPTLTYFRSEQPYVQASDLLNFDYRNYESMLYATLYRNKIIPTYSGYNTNGLLTQEKMRTFVLLCMLEFTITTQQLELRFVNMGYIDSVGQKT